jgi:proton-dependent oligopeptide transporter, POT family
MAPTLTKNSETQQPKGLYLLFFTEMWERFSFYGMRALLVLYLVSQFKLERAAALEIYAIFTGLVYVTPIIGGLLADKILGQRKAVFIGGILMAMGQFALAASPETFSLGLGLICAGNGFFKPNISTVVGALYKENDPRRDGGFTLFYMGINLGAFFSPLICGYLGEQVAWSYGFASAGVGMLLGVLIFFLGNHLLEGAGLPPATRDTQKSLVTKDYIDIAIYIVVSAALVFGVLQFWTNISDTIKGIIKVLFAVGGLGGLVYTLITNTKGNDEWSRVAVIFILLFFNVFFWAGFEQAGGTFNLFASENTDRVVFGNEIPASSFQSINAIFIFSIAPLFAMMWVFLNKIGKEPNIPLKFTLALAFLGIGFLVMHFAKVNTTSGLVSPMWLVMVYLFHTLGELCLSPVGLSMITKLAPPKVVSLMMGMWFASIASAQYLAGMLEAILHKFELPLFPFLVATSFIGSICLFLLSPWLKKMMKGVS